MSFSLSAFANGLAGANDCILKQQQYDAELKRQAEEQTYNRQRQATADQQATELHQQNVKRNDLLLQAGLKEQEEQKRVDDLKNRIGTLQGYKSNGDVDGAFNYALDYMNKSNEGNANWNPNHQFSYQRDADNPNQAILNVIDKTTGQLVRQVNATASTDSLIDMFYSQINPVQAYENKVANQAKASEELKKQDWELQKMKAEHNYKLDEFTHKGKIDSVLDNNKYQHNLGLEGIRQQGAYQREVIQQEGQNYRAENKIPITSKAVQQSGGALNYARNNLHQFQSLSVDSIFNHLTRQESASQHINPKTGQMTRSPKGALGIAQIMPPTAKDIYKETGIDVYSSAEANIAGGKYYLNKGLQQNGGDMTKALAAYNAGNGRLQQAIRQANKAGVPNEWLSFMPPETQHYVPKILSNFINTQGVSTASPQNGADYSQKTSAKSTDSIKTVSSQMTEELGYKGKNSATVLGGLSGIQPDVVQFVSAPTYQQRLSAYDAILKTVQRVVDRSPSSASMTVREKKEYIHQKAAELVGAKDKVEVGTWIAQGTRPQSAQAMPVVPAMDFSQINMTTPTPTKQPAKTTKPAKPLPVTIAKPTGQVENPFMTQALKSSLSIQR